MTKCGFCSREAMDGKLICAVCAGEEPQPIPTGPQMVYLKSTDKCPKCGAETYKEEYRGSRGQIIGLPQWVFNCTCSDDAEGSLSNWGYPNETPPVA